MIKGLYIWQIRNCENGNIERIVTRAKAAKLSHVLIKIANGAAGYNYIDGVDKAKELADALKIEGIDPIGWQYVFGVDPYGEAMTANRRMRETGCLGFAIDAEKEYRDDPANKAKATTYMANLDFPEPKAFASYRYPEVHPKMPYGVFLAGCDLVMPQVYWMEANNPTEQLDECIKQYRKITDLPILPTGSAFCEHGWCPTKQEIIDFAEHAKSLDLPGVNFWEWANTVANDFWITVKDIEWEETEPGFSYRVLAQSFILFERPGFIMENTAPDFATATDAEKENACYITENTGLMPDGTTGYVIQ